MPLLRFTLIGEGPTDDALISIVVWLLEHPTFGLLPDVEVVSRFVDRGQFPAAYGLRDRIIAAILDAPADVIVVHHDADGPTPELRVSEINLAVRDARKLMEGLPPAVPIVPVRETEAWLLLDESAIRRAARNPRGTAQLHLPRVHEVEACPDAKATLRDALRAASELPRRRRSQLDRIRPRAVADLIGDFAALRALPAFQVFEMQLRQVIAEQGWPERL